MKNSRNQQDDLMRTRSVNVNDSIYDDDPRSGRNGGGYRDNGRRYDDRYDEYDEYDDYDDRKRGSRNKRYDDEYDDYDDYDDRKRGSRNKRYDDAYDDRRNGSYDDRYDDGYDEYDDEYDDYDRQGGSGGNKKVIITTIIIVAVCIIGIVLIVFLGLKGGKKKEEAQSTTTQAVAQETTTQSVDITAAAITENQAMETIVNNLISEGIMNADYTTNDGGKFSILSEGIIIANNVAYYVVKTSYAPVDNPDNPTITYYGVNCQDGTCCLMTKSDSTGYTIVE